MQNKKEDYLFQLIKSLNKNEKRFFTLYSKLFSQNKTPNYLHLFKIMEKMPKYDPDFIEKKLAQLAPTKHPNQLKSYLKQNLLKALKLYDHSKIDLINQFNQISNSRHLFERNFIEEADKILQIRKKGAIENNQFILANFINMELINYTALQDQNTADRFKKLYDYHEESINLIDQQLELAKLNLIKKKIELIEYAKDKSTIEKQRDLKKILEEDLQCFDIENFKSSGAKDLHQDLYSIILQITKKP